MRSIFAQNVHISGRKYIFTFFACDLFKVKMKKKNVNNTRNTLYLGQTTSKYRSQISVVYVLANGFLYSSFSVSQYCKWYQTRKFL